MSVFENPEFKCTCFAYDSQNQCRIYAAPINQLQIVNTDDYNCGCVQKHKQLEKRDSTPTISIGGGNRVPIQFEWTNLCLDYTDKFAVVQCNNQDTQQWIINLNPSNPIPKTFSIQKAGTENCIDAGKGLSLEPCNQQTHPSSQNWYLYQSFKDIYYGIFENAYTGACLSSSPLGLANCSSNDGKQTLQLSFRNLDLFRTFNYLNINFERGFDATFAARNCSFAIYKPYAISADSIDLCQSIVGSVPSILFNYHLDTQLCEYGSSTVALVGVNNTGKSTCGLSFGSNDCVISNYTISCKISYSVPANSSSIKLGNGCLDAGFPFTIINQWTPLNNPSLVAAIQQCSSSEFQKWIPISGISDDEYFYIQLAGTNICLDTVTDFNWNRVFLNYCNQARTQRFSTLQSQFGIVIQATGQQVCLDSANNTVLLAKCGSVSQVTTTKLPSVIGTANFEGFQINVTQAGLFQALGCDWSTQPTFTFIKNTSTLQDCINTLSGSAEVQWTSFSFDTNSRLCRLYTDPIAYNRITNSQSQVCGFYLAVNLEYAFTKPNVQLLPQYTKLVWSDYFMLYNNATSIADSVNCFFYDEGYVPIKFQKHNLQSCGLACLNNPQCTSYYVLLLSQECYLSTNPTKLDYYSFMSNAGCGGDNYKYLTIDMKRENNVFEAKNCNYFATPFLTFPKSEKFTCAQICGLYAGTSFFSPGMFFHDTAGCTSYSYDTSNCYLYNLPLEYYPVKQDAKSCGNNPVLFLDFQWTKNNNVVYGNGCKVFGTPFANYSIASDTCWGLCYNSTQCTLFNYDSSSCFLFKDQLKNVAVLADKTSSCGSQRLLYSWKSVFLSTSHANFIFQRVFHMMDSICRRWLELYQHIKPSITFSPGILYWVIGAQLIVPDYVTTIPVQLTGVDSGTNVGRQQCKLFNVPIQYLNIIQSNFFNKHGGTFFGLILDRNGDCSFQNNTLSCPTAPPNPSTTNFNGIPLKNTTVDVYSGNCSYSGFGYSSLNSSDPNFCMNSCENDSSDNFLTSRLPILFNFLPKRVNDCYFLNETYACLRLPEKQVHQISVDQEEIQSYNMSFMDTTLYIIDCIFLSSFNQKIPFVNLPKCQALCVQIPGILLLILYCTSFNWGSYGECRLYNYEISLNILAPYSGDQIIQTMPQANYFTGGNCKIVNGIITCISPQDRPTTLSDRVIATVTTILTLGGNSTRTKEIEATATEQFISQDPSITFPANFSNSTSVLKQFSSLFATPTAPSNNQASPTGLNNQNSNHSSEPVSIIYVVAISLSTILVSTGIMHIYYAKNKLQNSIKESTNKTDVSNMAVPDSEEPMNLSKKSDLGHSRPKSSVVELFLSDQTGFEPDKQPFAYTSQTGIAKCGELIKAFLFPESLICKIKQDYTQEDLILSKGQQVRLVKHLFDGNILIQVQQNLYTVPLSLLEIQNLSRIILQICLDADSNTVDLNTSIINYALEVYPDKLSINIIQDYRTIEPQNWVQDGLFESISNAKKILINGDKQLQVFLKQYLDKVSDMVWVYFDVCLITDSFDFASSTCNYNPHDE
ncbi:hypothetical protein HDV06_006243 [Boothiomyces sp. JEL0866]|nr:hypothetical protein HDV06_006243 [Boothiomyces sp. JEL0866]